MEEARLITLEDIIIEDKELEAKIEEYTVKLLVETNRKLRDEKLSPAAIICAHYGTIMSMVLSVVSDANVIDGKLKEEALRYYQLSPEEAEEVMEQIQTAKKVEP
jgi:hypothetical protein